MPQGKQKITSSLWFDKDCEEAMNLYTSVFENSKIVSIKRYPEGPLGDPWKGMEGKVLTGVFELAGQRFIALDGGSYFKFNPAVSLFVNCATVEEVKNIFEKLSVGGFVMMPLQKYPFSEMYVWFADKYGLSWQINVRGSKEKIVPAFMFVGDKFGRAEEAIKFYTSIFKDSSIDTIARYEKGEGDEEGKVKYASFVLEGQQFKAMESSLSHKFVANGAISQYIECETQEEIDYYWDKLKEGGDEKAQQCGWLQDKFGFSWQVSPAILGKLLSDPDPIKSDRVLQAMLQMKKIDIAGLNEAYDKN